MSNDEQREAAWQAFYIERSRDGENVADTSRAFVAGWNAAKAVPVTIDREAAKDALSKVHGDYITEGGCDFGYGSDRMGLDDALDAIVAHPAAPTVEIDRGALATMIFSAMGEASMCWESVTHSGTFDSTRARRIGDELLAVVIAHFAAQPVRGTITDDMVERAARVMFEPPSVGDGEYTWDEMVREDPSRADMWRGDARAALAAALGGGSQSC